MMNGAPRSSRALALLCAGLLLASPAAAVVVHVAPGGVDQAGCGAVASPCATLDYALGLAEVVGPGDVVELAAGTYRSAAAISVDKSGAAGDPLVIRGQGTSTVLDGSDLGGGDARGLTLAGGHIALSDMTLTSSPGAPLRITGNGVVARDLVTTSTRGTDKPCVEVNGASDALLLAVRVDTCTGDGVNIVGSSATVLRQVEVTAAQGNGVRVANCSGTRLEGIWVHGNGSASNDDGIVVRLSDDTTLAGGPDNLPSVISHQIGYGVNMIDCASGRIEHAVVHDVDGAFRVGEGQDGVRLTLTVDHVTVTEVGAGGRAVFTDAAPRTSLTVTNSVFAFNAGGDITSDAVVHHHNLRYGNGSGSQPLDATELDQDPLLADHAGRDLHLMSAYGRWQPGTGWVQDGQSSPAIDLADPAADFSLEPPQNGGRANAGAFGNTAQASWSSAAGDGGTPDRATAADASTPDVSAPDLAEPDASPQDVALPDVGASDAVRADRASADAALPDTVAADAAPVDMALPDAAATDTVTGDGSALDAGAGDAMAPEAGAPDRGVLDASGQIVIARAGGDMQLTAPAQFTLDGTASVAPEGAQYVWTLADGPLGAGDAPLGSTPTVSVQLAIPGIYTYQLTITHGVLSDSDLVVVTITDEAEAAVEGCGCASAGGGGAGLTVLGAALLGIASARRRRAPAP